MVAKIIHKNKIFQFIGTNSFTYFALHQSVIYSILKRVNFTNEVRGIASILHYEFMITIIQGIIYVIIAIVLLTPVAIFISKILRFLKTTNINNGIGEEQVG
jgi:fucose 4-O-acetylase-like acetyltransferase